MRTDEQTKEAEQPLSKAAEAVLSGQPPVDAMERFELLSIADGRELWRCLDCDREHNIGRQSIGTLYQHGRTYCPVARERRAARTQLPSRRLRQTATRAEPYPGRSSKSSGSSAAGASQTAPAASVAQAAQADAIIPYPDPRLIGVPMYSGMWGPGFWHGPFASMGAGPGFQLGAGMGPPFSFAAGNGSELLGIDSQQAQSADTLAAGSTGKTLFGTQLKTALAPTAGSSAPLDVFSPRVASTLDQLRASIAQLEGFRTQLGQALQPLLVRAAETDQRLALMKAQLAEVEILIGSGKAPNLTPATTFRSASQPRASDANAGPSSSQTQSTTR